MKIKTTAPFRLDVGGGVTDIPQLKDYVGTAITNIAIDLYEDAAHQFARSINVETSYSKDNRNHLYFNDVKLNIEINQDDQFTFIKKIFAFFLTNTNHSQGTILKIFSSLPKGTGLGGSAVLSLCIFTSLHILHDKGKKIDTSAIMKKAHRFETTELGIRGGFQDYIGACFGGCNYIDFASLEAVSLLDHPNIGMQLAPVVEDFLNENMLFVIQKDNTINSSTIVEDEVKNFLNNKAEVTKQLEDIKESNTVLYDLLKKSRVDDAFWTTFGDKVNSSWQAQKSLSALVGIGRLHHIEAIAKPFVYGLRGPGAGGNSLFLLAKPNKKSELIKKLHTFNDEITILYGRINNEGIRISKEG